jgi:uncharacterized protein YbjT (DUF2867 family)
MTVLVTGATGNVGRAVVRELRERGAAVRALVRDPERAAGILGPGVELAAGNFEDPASLRRALAGAERVFLSSADGPRKVEHEAAVIDAARAAAMDLLVKASTLGADPASPAPALAWNGRSEDHLRRSGVPATILASGFYMTNVLAAADQVRATGTLAAPAGRGAVAMIDPADVGAVAAVALTGDGHAGRTYRLTGPRAIGYGEVAEALSRVMGRPVAYADVPETAARDALASAGMPDWLVQQIAGAFRLIREGALAETTSTVRELIGRDPRGFEAFAAAHAAAFAQPTTDAAASRASSPAVA